MCRVCAFLVLNRIAAILNQGGYLVLTTPNGHRVRNIIYMLLGREILDFYRYPESGRGLGHQHGYTLKQMIWPVNQSLLGLVSAEYYEDGIKGATKEARFAHLLLKPLTAFDHLKNGLMIVARK